jgi:hypothetical protein
MHVDLEAWNRYVLMAILLFVAVLYIGLLYAGISEFRKRVVRKGKRRKRSPETGS